MRFLGFGLNGGVNGIFGLEPAPVDPSKPDPRAREEMEAFDLLPVETRASVRESSNDIGLAGKLASVRLRGAPRSVVERARARGLMPFQLGEGGILAEMVADECATTAAGKSEAC